MPSCLSFSLLLILFLPTTALLPIPLTPAELNNTFNTRDRALGVSKSSIFGPLLSATRSGPENVPAASTYAAFAAYFEDATRGEGNCALLNKDKWPESLAFSAALRRWPIADKNCTSTTFVGEDSGIPPVRLATSPTDFMRLCTNQRLALNMIVGRALRAANLPEGWFPRPQNVQRTFRTGKYTVCQYALVTGIRYTEPAKRIKDGQWYILTGFSNDEPDVDKPQRQRRYLTEYLGVKDGKFLAPLAPYVRRWNNVSATREFRGDFLTENMNENRSQFATVLEQWQGRLGVSGLADLRTNAVPALIQALDLTDQPVGQAVDALTPSNVAILALPMALNIIPVALISSVTSFELLLYIIVTDVLTTIPFIIKGFELLHTGRKSYSAQEVWFSGKKLKPRWIIAESWVADCRLQKLETVGTVFVVIGFCLLIFGVLFEWLARRLRSKWIADGILLSSIHEARNGDGFDPERKSLCSLSPGQTVTDLHREKQAFIDNQLSAHRPLENELSTACGSADPPSSFFRRRSR